MIEITVKGMAFDSESQAPMVLLTDLEEKKFLPIFIGVAERDAIMLALGGIPAPRPLTHDLMKTLLDTFQAKLERVVIRDVVDDAYLANLVFDAGEGQPKIEVDCRPSDGIALALRMGAPMYASEVVMASAISNKAKVEKDMQDFKKFIEKVKPSDFMKYDDTHRGQPPEEKG